MKTKDILLTFDFELFLGDKSGSVENCLIKPTLEVKKIIDKYNLTSIFFVDTLYLYRLKKIASICEKAFNDYKKIINLLQSLIKSKSYIFHHIHPHWLDAIYLEDINQWDLSNKSRFAISNLTISEIEEVFFISNEILDEIYNSKLKPIYSGFRAGGLYAQPFGLFKSQFEKYNIKLDFSVLKNAKSTGLNGLYSFDYSNYPIDNIFSFSEDVVLKDDKGEFIEIMMDQFKLKGFPKIINGLYYRRNSNKDNWKRWGDGKASGNILKSTKKVNRFLSEETYSIELLNNYKASLYINQLKCDNFIHLISHPKLFSEANVEAFEKFISITLKKYIVETDVFKMLERSSMLTI